MTRVTGAAAVAAAGAGAAAAAAAGAAVAAAAAATAAAAVALALAAAVTGGLGTTARMQIQRRSLGGRVRWGLRSWMMAMMFGARMLWPMAPPRNRAGQTPRSAEISVPLACSSVLC